MKTLVYTKSARDDFLDLIPIHTQLNFTFFTPSAPISLDAPSKVPAILQETPAHNSQHNKGSCIQSSNHSCTLSNIIFITPAGPAWALEQFEDQGQISPIWPVDYTLTTSTQKVSEDDPGNKVGLELDLFLPQQ